MRKRIGVILICILFIGAGFVPCINGNIAEIQKELIDYPADLIEKPPEDELDQSQTDGYGGGCAVHSTFSHAQSFVPTFNFLSKIELLLYVDDEVDSDPILIDQPIFIHIRDDLDGDDLTSFSLLPEDLPWGWVEDFVSWITIDFSDIQVTPGSIYYIILTSPHVLDWENIERQMIYIWWQSDTNRYFKGMRFTKSHENPWESYSNKDFSFKTYGYNDENQPGININEITGGFGIKADIKNNGATPVNNLSWSIDVEASFGLILSGGHTSDVIDELVAGASETIQSNSLRGIGLITITIQAGDAEKQATAFLLGPLVLRVNEI